MQSPCIWSSWDCPSITSGATLHRYWVSFPRCGSIAWRMSTFAASPGIPSPFGGKTSSSSPRLCEDSAPTPAAVVRPFFSDHTFSHRSRGTARHWFQPAAILSIAMESCDIACWRSGGFQSNPRICSLVQFRLRPYNEAHTCTIQHAQRSPTALICVHACMQQCCTYVVGVGVCVGEKGRRRTSLKTGLLTPCSHFVALQDKVSVF